MLKLYSEAKFNISVVHAFYSVMHMTAFAKKLVLNNVQLLLKVSYLVHISIIIWFK